MVSSSGRVDIWKVAWQEFEGAPVLGVGADNFVFQYDRLRTAETYKPQQAHSLELQVLGETGIVGGIFAFGGILLAFGGLALATLHGRMARGANRRGCSEPPRTGSAEPPEPDT